MTTFPLVITGYMEFDCDITEEISENTYIVEMPDQASFDKLMKKYANNDKARKEAEIGGFAISGWSSPEDGKGFINIWCGAYGYYENHCGFTMGEWMDEISNRMADYLIRKSQA